MDMDGFGSSVHAGDVVRMSSGGPLMIVESVQQWIVCCCWRNNNQLNRGYFHPAMIERVITGDP